MATFSQIANIANQTDFRNRVGYALSVASVSVYAEAGTTTGHAARAAYASKVLNGSFDLSGVVLGVLTNSTIASGAAQDVPGNSIADGDIQFAVNSIFSALAGA